MFAEVTHLVTRQRARTATDPYQPRRKGSPDWSQPDEPTLCLAFAPSGTSSPTDADRSPALAGAAFYGDDPHTDVIAGDRLVQADGTVWRVQGHPVRWDACGSDFPGGIVIHVERATEERR